MSMMEIGYRDDPIPDYTKAIDAATNVSELRAAIEPFGLIANDALLAVRSMTEDEWPSFKRGLKMERSRKFAGMPWQDRYGCVLLPTVMLMVGMTATHFHAPWGCAYIRLRDMGDVVEKDGVASWIRKEPPCPSN